MSSISSIQPDASSIRADYLNLLVSQLRYQNPLEPISNTEFTAQLAQLSELEQLENLNSSFAKVLAAQQLGQATALVGKEVTFVPVGGGEAAAGRVESANLADGEVRLVVGSHELGLGEIISVRN
ncbi:MAG TPA: flagellar hook capping FlgD N-terminal domain-containing protein [Phycisphaerae bacterium]|nr:flagellar hook capping FlgD N-terminal domain-containing protein [Phycisphaerae bacterium]